MFVSLIEKRMFVLRGKEICFTKAEFGVIMDYPKGRGYE